VPFSVLVLNFFRINWKYTRVKYASILLIRGDMEMTLNVYMALILVKQLSLLLWLHGRSLRLS